MAASDTIRVGTTGGSNVHSHGLDGGYAKINHHDGKFYFAEESLGDNTFTSTGSGEAKGASETSNQTDVVSLGGTTETSSSLPPYLAVYMWKRIA